jgi:hypothetical protein
MNVQKTHAAIVAEIERRRKVIAESGSLSPAPFSVDGDTVLDALGDMVSESSVSPDAARIVQAVNAEADMLDLCEKFARKAQADYRACEAVWKQTTGMEFVRLINDADAARDRLFLVARALRVEVVE